MGEKLLIYKSYLSQQEWAPGDGGTQMWTGEKYHKSQNLSELECYNNTVAARSFHWVMTTRFTR
jgi:hypothetical protein